MFLVYSSKNASTITDNYTAGFTIGSTEYGWYTDETGTEDYSWNFDTVWAIDTRTDISENTRVNGGLPYIRDNQPRSNQMQFAIEYSGSDKFLIVVEYGDSACAFTYSGIFTFSIFEAECKVSIIGYNGTSSLTLNGALQTISNNACTISLGDTNNIVLTLG